MIFESINSCSNRKLSGKDGFPIHMDLLRQFVEKSSGTIVFLCSIIVNSAVLIDYMSSPFSKYPLWDAANYWNQALEIAGGSWIGSAIFHQTPLYPYFLALFIAVFGDTFFPVYVFQCVLSATTSLLVTKVTFKVIGSSFAGLLSGIIYALYGMQVFYATKLLSENLALFLIVLTVWLLLTGKKKSMVILTGLSYGLLLIMKSYFLFALPVILLFFYQKEGYSRNVFIKRTLQFLLPCMLIIFIVVIRNYHVGGEFVLFTSNFGENVYIGNHENATGTYVPIKGVSSDIAYQDSDVVALAQKLSGDSLSRSDVSKFWFRKSIEFIVKNPVKYLGLECKKLYFIVSGIDLTNMYIIDFEKRYFTRSLALPFINYYVLFPFFLIGICYAFASWKKYLPVHAFLFTNIIMMLLFFYDSRFLLVSMPFFITIAALGFQKLFISIRDAARLRKFSVNAAVVALLCGLPLGYSFYKKNRSITAYDAQKWMAVGEIYYSLGKLELSADAFVNASNLNKFDFWPAMGISKVVFALGKKEAAADLFKKSYTAMTPEQKLSVKREKEYDNLRAYIVANGIMDSTAFRIDIHK